MSDLRIRENGVGNPIELKVDLDIVVESTPDVAGVRAPGQGWTVSDGAKQEMLEIDARIRAAEQISGNIVFD